VQSGGRSGSTRRTGIDFVALLRPAPKVADLVSRWIDHCDLADEFQLHVCEIARVAERHQIAPSGTADPALADLSAVAEMGALARRALTVDAWMGEFSRLPTPTEQPSRGVLNRLRPKKASVVEPLLHPDDLDTRRRTLESLVARANVLAPIAEASLAEQRQKLIAAMVRKRAGVVADDDGWFSVGRGSFDGVEVAVGWEPRRGALVIADSSAERVPQQSAIATQLITRLGDRVSSDSDPVVVIGEEMATNDLRDLATSMAAFGETDDRCYGLVDATSWSGKPAELRALSDSILDLSDPRFEFAGRQIPLIWDSLIDRVEVVAT
jgi:hypothetical protein